MGAIVIGIGAALAVLGFVLGAMGYGSSETAGAGRMMTVGSSIFIGGLLLVALGSILRVLREIADKLEGAVHFEPEEDEFHTGHGPAGYVAAGHAPGAASVASARVVEEEEFVAVSTALPEDEPALIEEPTAEERGLPSWFRRKRQEEAGLARDEEVELEPEASPLVREPAPDFDSLPSPRPAPAEPFRAEPVRPEPSRVESSRIEPPRREPPPFLRTGSAERPAPGLGGETFEPRVPEPRLPDPRAPEPRAPETRLSEPRPPEPRPSRPPEEAPAEPPAFLRDADLLSGEPEVEEPEAEPDVTVLKSGTIGGMAYKLYSDGSIEADLPDGTLRFASLQELRDHVSGGANRA
ncbi:Uncharacterised protein [Starkeya nomas]|uniref:DUF308 domain-containing protein n=2 Tax=Starkeya nomas TaxID=2666134 RepID=A0A5S9NET3_9HYPH|nr:Uncharacterised protein [Starkeya nomas]